MRKSAKRPSTPAFGRGTGVPDPIDIHVGSRIRTRRIYLDMRQEELGRKLGLTFQQVQKYESGANRVSASRLSEIADVLGVSVEYFFGGLSSEEGEGSPEDHRLREMMQRTETIELVRVYYGISDPSIRRQFLEMVKVTANPHRDPV